MSRRKPPRFPVPSKNYLGGQIIDFVPHPGDPDPSQMVNAIPPRPVALTFAPGDSEEVSAGKKAALAAAVVRLVEELAPGTHRPAAEEAAREFVDRLARALQPAPTCQLSVSKNSTATPSADGTAP